MRATQLARAAAEAEGLRLKQMLRRQVYRVIYGVVALVFLIALLAVLHAVAFVELRLYFEDLYALLIVLAADLIFLVIFGLMAARNSPGHVEREALQVRKDAVAQLGANVSSLMVLRPVLSMLPGRHLYSLVLAGLTARHLSRR